MTRLQHFDEAAANEARNVGDERQCQRYDRQNEIARIGSFQARDRQPPEANAKDQNEQRAGDETRQRDAQNRKAHDAVIKRASAPQRSPSPKRQADAEGKQERAKPERQAHRQALRDERADRQVAVLHGRPEIPVRDPGEIPPVLADERLIEAVGALKIRLHLRRQGLLRVERTARCHTDDHERDGDDDEESGQDGGEAARGIRKHSIVISARRGAPWGLTGAPAVYTCTR